MSSLSGGVLGDRAAHRGPVELGAVAAQALLEAGQDLELAFEDVHLGFHDGRSFRERHQLGRLVDVLAVGLGVCRQDLLGRLDRFCS